MFLVVVQKQHQYVTGQAGVWAVSSKTSDRPATEKARRPYVVSRRDGITISPAYNIYIWFIPAYGIAKLMKFTEDGINFIEEVGTQQATPGRESVSTRETNKAVKTICSCLTQCNALNLDSFDEVLRAEQAEPNAS